MTTLVAPPLRVLLVDDHAVVREGLRSVLGRAGIEVIGEAGTVADAVSACARLVPDLVLMDVRLPDGSGVEACREIRSANSSIRVLFLTAFEDDSALISTVFAGTGGYLLKEIDATQLVEAVKTVASGLSVLGPGGVRPALEQLSISAAGDRNAGGGDPLSKQEQRVLALVAEGKTNKDIAVRLGLSPKTVKNYLSTVFEKLQVRGRTEALARVLRDFRS